MGFYSIECQLIFERNVHFYARITEHCTGSQINCSVVSQSATGIFKKMYLAHLNLGSHPVQRETAQKETMRKSQRTAKQILFGYLGLSLTLFGFSYILEGTICYAACF